MLSRRCHAKPKSSRSWWCYSPSLLVSLAGGMVVLGSQDWQLFTTVSAGAIAMLVAYAYQQSPWQRNWRKQFNAFWHSPTRPLVVAVVVGSLTTIFWQMVLAIWTETPNPWLALALTTQLLATVAVLVLLLRHQWGNYLTEEPKRSSPDRGDRPMGLPSAQQSPLRQLVAREQELVQWERGD
jgi:hypothetical protein